MPLPMPFLPIEGARIQHPVQDQVRRSVREVASESARRLVNAVLGDPETDEHTSCRFGVSVRRTSWLGAITELVDHVAREVARLLVGLRGEELVLVVRACGRVLQREVRQREWPKNSWFALACRRIFAESGGSAASRVYPW